MCAFLCCKAAGIEDARSPLPGDLFGVAEHTRVTTTIEEDKLASKVSRAALVAGLAIGVSGLVAVPAEAANSYVTQPVVTGVSSITPESAVLSGAIDTGGDPASTFVASAASPFSVGGLSITASGNLNGFPVNQGYYSTVLFEADPLSDYVASGNQPGGETVTAANIEVPTTTGLSAVSSILGAYPAASNEGATPLTPGTKYVYWLVEQAGETDQATTVNEFSTADLASWAANSGNLTANGFAASSAVSGSNGYAAWFGGTGKYVGDPGDPNNVPGQMINPDWQCVVNSTIAANTNATWTAELAANKVPLAPGATTINGTALPFGIGAVAAGGTLTAQAAQQPAEQGPCVAFYGGNSTNFYTSPVGYFTTPKLGTVVFGSKGVVSGSKVAVSVADKSVEKAAGKLALTVKSHGKTVTVASGKISVVAGATKLVVVKLSGAGKTALAAAGSLTTKVSFTSTTDQPTKGKTVTLTLAK
jgi:hypothetical protein